MRGEDPEWDQNKTFVEPWKPIPFLLGLGFIALAFAGFVWLLIKVGPAV
jgi:hypothetical protein